MLAGLCSGSYPATNFKQVKGTQVKGPFHSNLAVLYMMDNLVTCHRCSLVHLAESYSEK